MSLTKIDCYFHRGRGASLDTSSYVALNPCQRPGSLVVAGACAARGNIGGQVACRLALEHFVDGVFEHYSEAYRLNGNAAQYNAEGAQESSVAILESAFKRANSSVYDFGHKLAAGGRMAASLIGLVVEDKVIAAGKVGSGSAILLRGGELFPFFEIADESAQQNIAPNNEGFVGSNSLVSVELACVPSCEDDLILIFSGSLTHDQHSEIKRTVGDLLSEPFSTCADVANKLRALIGEMAFFVAARVGPEAVYLSRAVA